MRKIYVLLILLGLLAVAIFADSGWLNAQTEIQKSFNANSPGQNLQNQLLGSTNTNNTFLNLNGSNVSALSAGQSKGSTTSTTVTVSTSQSTTIKIHDNLPGSSNWTYGASPTSYWSISGIKFSVSYCDNNHLYLSINIPSSLSPGTYSGSLSVYGQNSGKDSNLWVETVNLTIIYKEQIYVATATSYDASFCGATGNPLIGQYQPASEEAGVLLAKLTVQSNMATIDVYVTPTFTGSSNLSTSLLKYYNNGSSWTSRPTMNLNGSSGLYTGELDVVLPYPNSIPQWTQTGRNVLKIVFVVTPKISGF